MELYVDYKFKKITDNELKVIDEAIENIMRKFTIIFSNTEACVYKITRHIIDKYHFDERNIKMLDGTAIECYLDITANPKYNHIQIQNQLDHGVLSDISGKIFVIPKMTNDWNKELAFYFYNEIRYAGCLGIIFYSTPIYNNKGIEKGGNHFGKILLEETTLDVIQFPNKIFGKRKIVEDDEW